MIAPIGAAHEERIPIVSAQIGAGPEAGPEARIVDDLVVAGAERLQFGPAIDFPFDKPAGLHGFEHAVVVEISQARFPGETAAGQAELFAAMNVRGDSFLHFADLAGAQPEKVAFGEAEFRGDIAHVDIQQAVAIHIAEIHAHAFEGIVSQHA